MFVHIKGVKSLTKKDYDISVLYQPGKDNIVADSLSHMTMGSVSHFDEGKKNLEREVHRLSQLGVSWKVLQMGVVKFIIVLSHL